MLKLNRYKYVRVFLILCFGTLFINVATGDPDLTLPIDGFTGDGPQTSGQHDDLTKDKEEFDKAWNNKLTVEEQGVISKHCGFNWAEAVQSMNRREMMNTHFSRCDINLRENNEFAYGNLLNELEVGPQGFHSPPKIPYHQIFPEYETQNFSDQLRAVENKTKDYEKGEEGNLVSYGAVFLTAKKALIMEQEHFKAFLKDRKELMNLYKCPQESSDSMKCFNQRVEAEGKKCLEKVGFKKCRPFLACDKRGKVHDLRELSAELSGKNEKGMVSICQKAATQGAQCCMNPDQCPTDGPFRSIAGQLKQAAPGLIQQYAGFKNITGKNQAACRAGLLSNAAGPLAGLQAKTCDDSSKICEETCDEKVQNFKARLKQALTVKNRTENQDQTAEIDELVKTAKKLNEGKDIPEDEDTITTCSLMLVKLNRDFKKRDEDKKLRGLTEQLSHADIVDCSEQVNKYALHRRRGGGLSAGAGGINPFAAGMCRGAAGSKFALPKGNFAQTPNPKLGSAHLLGGKTVPGTGGSAPYTGGPGGLPEEEFIEPERGLAGADQLTGGWTESPGDSLGASTGGASGGSQQTPSGNEPGSKEPWDTSPTAMQEAFDFGESNGEGAVSLEDMSPEERERWKRALEMEAKDTKKLMEKTPLEHFKNRPGEATIFDRMNRIHREWCKRGNCISPEEWEKRQAQERNKPLQYSQ